MRLLKSILERLGKVVVAYSGGLDSTFLLKTAIDTLGRDNVLAVTARSETYPLSEYKEAKRIAKMLGARHMTINTSELRIKNFKSNPVNRCYYCKSELFKKLDGLRKKYKMRYVLDGTNYDDLKDIRHGMKAALELGVRSLLLEARLTKKDIRKFSKALGLPTWDKPSFACLASRFPFGDLITKKDLGKVEEAEKYIRSLGVKQARVRLHRDTARIEAGKGDFRKLVSKAAPIVRYLKGLGFVYISMDLAGYRTGSMHEAA